MSLLKYIARRLLIAVPVIFGVMTLTFILSRFMPGDPVLAFIGEGRFSEDYYWQLYNELGLNDPLIVQYFRYLGDVLVGNWGYSQSIAKGMDVWELIMLKLPRTADIAIFSIIIAAVIGIKAGVISATHRNKFRDTFFRGLSLVGVAVPVFFLGMLLQYLLAIETDFFPATGFKTEFYEDPDLVTGFRWIDALIAGQFYMVTDYFYHLVLPVFCLSFISLAGIVRQTRSSMLEVLEQDYIRTARAKGCKEKDVINTHAKKNAMIPTVTVIGLGFGGLLTGAVLTETTFGLAGLGQLLIDAITNSDYWVLNGLVFFFALVFIFINLITDVVYGILDPRIRY
ncbi:MAG: ABC transporter permease [Promethearchaeota archaeon]|nr:MAG: ABC transporter permease [Candidatus Lokiarchaeota archaeon]